MFTAERRLCFVIFPNDPIWLKLRDVKWSENGWTYADANLVQSSNAQRLEITGKCTGTGSFLCFAKILPIISKTRLLGYDSDLNSHQKLIISKPSEPKIDIKNKTILYSYNSINLNLFYK